MCWAWTVTKVGGSVTASGVIYQQPWATLAQKLLLLLFSPVYACCFTDRTQMSRVRESRGGSRRTGIYARTGRLVSSRCFPSLAGSEIGLDHASHRPTHWRVGAVRLGKQLYNRLGATTLRAAVKFQWSIPRSRVSDSPGASPACFNFPACLHPAGFTQLICNCPPQIDSLYNNRPAQSTELHVDSSDRFHLRSPGRHVEPVVRAAAPGQRGQLGRGPDARPGADAVRDRGQQRAPHV